MVQLGYIQPVRRPRARIGRGYSWFVWLMKLLLPTIAVGLVVLVAVWSQFNLDETRFRVGALRVSAQNVNAMTMSNPRYDGIDSKNRPFSVTAETAIQSDTDPDVVDLGAPKADVTMADGTWISLSADSGRYMRDLRQLDLRGAVSLYQDRGYELHADTAHIDLELKEASSQEPVEGHGPAGEIAGDGFHMTDDGHTILLTGRSRVLLNETSGTVGQ